MPTVSVGRDRLFKALGRSYMYEEFDDLCNRFGIELRAVAMEKKAIIGKEKHLGEDEASLEDIDEEVVYKIHVPPNRCDLLCLEGISQALRIFIGINKIPVYKTTTIPVESRLKMLVKSETQLIRPYVVCAVLRGITFDDESYNSFIDLQDKLHQNICRERTLVAIGTHDLDTLDPPFTYEALPPSEINFVPLKQVKCFRGDELMEFYKSDMKLKKFLHIIEHFPVYPVIYDSKRRVLSLPPIINGAHSAITLKTKNVLIECTATDQTKAEIVLNTMVTIFSVYSARKYEAEPVEVVYSDGKTHVYPNLSDYSMDIYDQRKASRKKPTVTDLRKRGVCYISRIPPRMDHVNLRHVLSRYGEVERIYLAPENPSTHIKRKRTGGFRGIQFSEGWVEFADKSVAKRVARFLNGQQIGGKKRSRFYYDIWNIKYLRKFKWDDLTEEIANKHAIKEQKMALEMSAAKRERDFYLSKVDQAHALNSMEERAKKKQKTKSGEKGDTDDDHGNKKKKVKAKVIRQFPQNRPVNDAPDHKRKPGLSKDILAGVFGGSTARRKDQLDPET